MFGGLIREKGKKENIDEKLQVTENPKVSTNKNEQPTNNGIWGNYHAELDCLLQHTF